MRGAALSAMLHPGMRSQVAALAGARGAIGEREARQRAGDKRVAKIRGDRASMPAPVDAVRSASRGK